MGGLGGGERGTPRLAEEGPRAIETASAPDIAGSGRPCWSSAQLFAGGDEAQIEHQGGLYRLRRTRNGGLLLTK